MKKNIDNNRQDYNEPFDQWLRQNKPQDRPFTQDMDTFVEGVTEKMHTEQKARAVRVKKNFVRSSVFVLVLLMGGGFFNMTDLGSDGFKLVEVEGPSGLGRFFKNEFRGDGFNVMGDETEEHLQDINQQIAGDDGIAVKADGLVYRGETKWFITKEHTILGKKRTMTEASRIPETVATADWLTFLMGPWSPWQKKIDAGQLKPNGKQITKKLDGITYLMDTWIIDDPAGQIIYYRGVPIRSLSGSKRN